MLRQGLRRCALAAGRATTTTATPLLRSARTSALPTSIVSRLSVQSTWKTIASLPRLYSTEADAAVEQSETPTGEIDQFSELSQYDVHPTLLDAITKGMGYSTMSPVQVKTIAPALKGTDIVAQARTGTGKTLAFLLPLVQRMIQEDPKLVSRGATRTARADDVRGIILSPTRELAEQIAVEARRLLKNTGLVVQCAVGGTNRREMLRQAQRQGCHLLVATPGRLNDLLSDESSGIEAPNLAALVLDEADRMLDVGFERELNNILEMLPNVEEKTRQTMLVSATIPDNVIRLARSMVRHDDFEFIQTISENESLTHDKIPQNVVTLSSWSNVFPALFELIDNESARLEADPSQRPFKAIVYFNTTSLVQAAGEMGYARRRAKEMTAHSYAIHSQLSQNSRTKAADYFRRAKSAVLFSSDVTARGMDFPDVTHVIQIDCPRDRESYIHRLGRTGRQDKDGEGWLFLPPCSAHATRQMLRGMPIKQNTSLENTTADPAAEDQSKHQELATKLYSLIPESILTDAYTSIFGSHRGDKNELAEDLRTWTTKGWGWEQPPQVSMGWAKNQGLRTNHLNIRDGRRTRDSNTDGESTGSDPFTSMASQVRREEFGKGGGRFGGGRSGGFGGNSSRDSGRGFGRDSGRGGFSRGSGRGSERDSRSGGRRDSRDNFRRSSRGESNDSAW